MHLFPVSLKGKLELLLLLLFFMGKPAWEITTSKKGIDFYNGSYQEALEKAQEEKKLIFIYFYADWCGVCKKLKKNTLRDKNVGEFYNEEYVSLAYNAEKGDGRLIAKNVGVSSYPTLLFVDGKSGRILNRISGYKSPHQLINLGKIYTQ